jgi:hypothetical protein
MERQIPGNSRKNPYRDDSKPAGTPSCKICHAVSVRGRWIPEREASKKKIDAEERAAQENTKTCPACQQMRDRYALGVVELHGDSWREHADLVLRTIENTEQIARARNDQERVLWSRTVRGVTRVYVTLPELARMIGHELGRTFKGKIDIVNGGSKGGRQEGDFFLRVVWDSDAKAPKQAQNARTPHTEGRSKHWRSRGAA